ncbi:MAG: hypothetical protein ACTSW8_08070 [Candidatus Thorarchaeota archaeon]
MLETGIVAFGIIAGWIVFGISAAALLQFRGKKIPAGSVLVERSDDVDLKVTSPRWIKFGVLFAMGGCILVSIMFVVLVVSGS